MMKTIIALACCAGLVGCAAQQHSATPTAFELALEAARDPAHEYLGTNAELGKIFAAFRATDKVTAFATLGCSGIAELFATCLESSPYLEIALLPEPNGVRVIIDGSCESDEYFQSYNAGKFITLDGLNNDPDADLDKEALSVRYGLNAFKQHTKHDSTIVYPKAMQMKYLLDVGQVLWAERYGVDMTVACVDGQTDTNASITVNLNTSENDHTIATPIHAGIVDAYGNGNGIATSWEYGRFRSHLLRMLAVSTNPLVDHSTIETFEAMGIRIAEASQWIERVRALAATSGKIKFPDGSGFSHGVPYAVPGDAASIRDL